MPLQFAWSKEAHPAKEDLIMEKLLPEKPNLPILLPIREKPMPKRIPLSGGWGKSSPKSMYKYLTRPSQVYQDSDLMNMKRQKVKNRRVRKVWLTRFIKKLEL